MVARPILGAAREVHTHEIMVVAGHGAEEFRRVRGFATAADVAKSVAAVLDGPD